MKKYSIRPYQESDYELWNTFVSAAKNATFLFHRDFMEYHKERFEDFSLLVFDKVKLVAVLPANRVDNKVSRIDIRRIGVYFQVKNRKDRSDSGFVV